MGDYRKNPHWVRASDGAWAVCIPGARVSIGTQGFVRKANGEVQHVTVTRYREKGADGHLYSADTSADDRMNRAYELTDFTVDADSQSGSFVGRGGEVYNTTTTNCTCKDFLNRGEPCKHIYRLVAELKEPFSFTKLIEALDEEIKPKSPPILYKVVAVLFWLVAVVGVVLFIYALIHGTTGETVFGAVLAIVCAFIGAAAFSVSKEAKANMNTTDENDSNNE